MFVGASRRTLSGGCRKLLARNTPTLSAFHSSAGQFKAQISGVPLVEQPLPPNLTIDPRSSFAPLQEDIYDDYSEYSDDETLDDDNLEEFSEGEADPEARYITQPEVVYAVPLPERLHVDIHTLFLTPENSSSKVGTIHLDSTVFGREPVRVDLLKRAVDYYRAKKRGKRKAVTKTIGQVSGSGRKLRAQKGQGRARVGHSRPPHFRGGAKAHGPKNVTDYGKIKMNRHTRRLALVHALSQKLYEGNLIVLDSLVQLDSHKTRELIRLLEPWNIGKGGQSTLLLDHYVPEDEDSPEKFHGVPVNVWVASQNIKKLNVGSQHFASVYQLLLHDKLILTLSAIEQLEARLKNL